MMKKLFLKLKILTLKIILSIHSLTYNLAGPLSQKIEKNGIHPKHRIMNYHNFFLENLNENDTVLDVGCGNGALTYDLGKKVKKIIGIDINENNIIIAKNKFSRKNIEYIHGDILTEIPNQRFDVIILSNVLEHIDNRQELLKKLKKSASKFLIRVPMINRSWIDLYKKELGLEYRLDKTHKIEYTLKIFKNEIEGVGLNIIKYSIQFGEIWAVVINNDLKNNESKL